MITLTIMVTLLERARSFLPKESRTPTPSALAPEQVFFPRAKRWFKKKSQNGISNRDLHNATRLGVVNPGAVLLIQRASGETSKLIYVGAGNPFINERTGEVNHLLFDFRASNGSRIIPVYDISFWQKEPGRAPREQIIRLKRAIDEYHQHHQGGRR